MIRRATAVLAVVLTLAIGAIACYEIPPELPEGYVGSPASPGWPPRAVYDSEPFHPANRLHQRVFVLEHPDGFDAVDIAEIETLVERVLKSDLPARERSALVEDMRREAARLRETGGPGAAKVADALDRLIEASSISS